MSGLIIEGVAGTGKSTLFEKLKMSKRSPRWKLKFISEEETLGELFSEMRDRSVPHSTHVQRLQKILNRIETAGTECFVLERFHHSFYALGIEWELLEPIDRALANLSFTTVLLDLDDELFDVRCFDRPEKSKSEWQEGFIQLYGTRAKAVAAFKESQNRRRESLQLSEIPSHLINTSTQEWDRYLEEVFDVLGLPL